MLFLDKSREDLATLFKGKGAEIGVEQGRFSEVIAQHCNKLYCIDAWKAYSDYKDHQRQEKLDRYYWRTKKRLKPYNVEIIRKFSMDAVKDFPDESLDFVYIDANHDYKHTLEDIVEWSKKVRKGGIVAGHDYIDRPERGETYKVKEAVNDYCKQYGYDLTIYLKANSPSWMFRK